MQARPAIERFEEKIERIPFSGCWIWTATVTHSGYGHMRAGGSRGLIMAHRFAYGHFISAIPDGMLVCHRCDVPACCNPAHLFLGTYKDNAHDRDRKLRAGVSTNGTKTHCPRGHEYTPENTMLRRDRSGRWCRACKIYFRGRVIQSHALTTCELVRIDGEGRFRSGLFKCGECAREVRQHMNHLGQRVIVCNGSKTIITAPHAHPSRIAFHKISDALMDEIQKHGR